MRWWVRTIAGVCLVAAVSAPAAPQATRPAAAKWVSGFYVGYMADIYPPSAIDFGSLTHVMVFSVRPQRNGTLDTALFIDRVNGPRTAQDVATRAHAAGRKAILVIGGSDTQAGFTGATSSENLSTFVRSIVDTVSSWGFDGVDIDWEPLPASDHAAMLTLLQRLKAARPGLIVTTDVGYQTQNLPLNATDARFYAQLAGAVDQMNMMTYGMADSWDGWVVWHSSALQSEGRDHPTSIKGSVREYVGAGVPASKLGMGIGFYGSCWSAPATAPLQAPLSSHVVAGDNEISVAAIANGYYRQDRYRYDAAAQAPYLSFTVPTGPKRCTFISYEDETSVAAKGRYAVEAGLGGTIIWHLNEGNVIGQPDPSSLLHAVGRAFGVSAPDGEKGPRNKDPKPPRPPS